MTKPNLDAIQRAAGLIRDAGLSTPVVRAPALSASAGADIQLKLESLQPTGSFKVRGTLVKMRGLTPDQRRTGVVAMSAGNHAQGVAYHAQALGIPATIVMPAGTPFNKIARTEALGARVVVDGDSLAEARRSAEKLRDEQDLTLVHPYDDPDIIAGQGTVGLEFLEADPALDAILVPVGGGGLIAGIALAVKALDPSVEVIGVQVATHAAMAAACFGHADPGKGGPTVAEGIAVKEAGKLTGEIVRDCVADMLVVSETEIEDAMLDFLTDQKLVVEGAAAAPLAALWAHRPRFEGRRVGLVVSGGNADSRLLSSLLLRGLAKDGQLARLRVEITDRPGALAELTAHIGEAQGNIVEVVHQRLFYDIPIQSTEVDMVIEARDRDHVSRILAGLRTAGYEADLLSNLSDENGHPGN